MGDQGEGGLGQPARGWERALERGEDVLRHQAKQLVAPGQGGHHCQGAVWRTGLPVCFEDWNLLWKCSCRTDCGGRQLCSHAEGGQGTSWLVQAPQGCRTSHLGFGEREALGISVEGQREPAVHRTEKEDGQCYGVHQGGEKDARDPEAHRRLCAELAPNSLGLIESFGLPEEMLQSPIASDWVGYNAYDNQGELQTDEQFQEVLHKTVPDLSMGYNN